MGLTPIARDLEGDLWDPAGVHCSRLHADHPLTRLDRSHEYVTDQGEDGRSAASRCHRRPAGMEILDVFDDILGIDLRSRPETPPRHQYCSSGVIVTYYPMRQSFSHPRRTDHTPSLCAHSSCAHPLQHGDRRQLHGRYRSRGPGWTGRTPGAIGNNGNRAFRGVDLPPRAVPHPMLVPAPVEGREGRASSGTRATA